MRLRKKTSCRICGNKNLVEILSFGNLAVSGFFEEDTEGIHAPLTLTLCDPGSGGCSLVQLAHQALHPDLLYRQYWYKSGISQTMKDALKDVAKRSEQFVELNVDDIILDIGSNDGTLLNFYNDVLKKIGFEPSVNILKEAENGNATIINNYFNKEEFLNATSDNAHAKIINSIAMFYDLENPHEFMRDITEILAPDGIWINQLSYLPLMLSQNAFDNTCHEHIEYYSLTSMQKLLEKYNLECVDVELNDVNGGSFRMYIGHKDAKGLSIPAGGRERVVELLEQEKQQGLSEKETYEAFAQRVRDIRTKTRKIIRSVIKNKGTVFVYGASTKGNTLLQYFGLDHTMITACAERNPSKWGKKTVATNIPIISEEEARKLNPTHFLVLPWHFKKEFIEREREYLENGGKMIFPLPEFEIVTKDDLIIDNNYSPVVV
jgi:NDP-4-keto-2,6-dideoxyhexose 3-C-methyltransferase